MKFLVRAVTIMIIASLSICSYGQIVVSSKDGRSFLLLDNGTWKPVKDKAVSESPARNCDKYISVKHDRVTGDRHVSSADPLVISNQGKGKSKDVGIVLLVSKSEITTAIYLVAVGGSCVDEGDIVNILFRDGTRIALKNWKDFNCKGDMALYLSDSFGTGEELRYLQTKEIEIIRAWTSDTYVEETLTREQSRTILESFKCLTQY